MKPKRLIALSIGAFVITNGFMTVARPEWMRTISQRSVCRNESETSIGKLKLEAGAPTPETAQTVYDYLDQMRGVQAFLDNQGPASMFAMRRAYQKMGSKTRTSISTMKNPWTRSPCGWWRTRRRSISPLS